LSVATAGLPPLEEITKLANELFAALPGQFVSPEAAESAEPLASPAGAAPTAPVMPPAPFGPLSDANLDALSISMAGVPSTNPAVDTAAIGAGPGISPAAGLGPLSEADLRALPASLAGTAPTASPVDPGSSAGSPGESPSAPFGPLSATEFQALPTTVGGPLGQSPPSAVGFPVSVPGNAGILRAPGFSASAPSGFSLYTLDTFQPAPVHTAPTYPQDPFDFQSGTVPELGLTSAPFDPRNIRRDFPILQEHVNGRPLVWLDNAATTQKPDAVIDRVAYFYRHENSNVHRAAHTLAARSTDAYEGAREKVRRFINASSTREVVFVRGTTEGINLVAQSWGRRNVEKDDEIVVTWLEHHANIVPWQMLCAEKGAHLRVAPVDDRGQIILDEYEKLINSRTRLVAFTQVSNAIGTVLPAREMVQMARRHGARVLVDGAQSIAHMRTDVQALDCDFYIFSGHKVFAPTGIGVVFGKADLLDTTPPWQGGGGMIADVTFEKTVYQPAPGRFEAGTGSIADAVGLGAALDYLGQLGIENVTRYEHALMNYALSKLQTVPGLHLIGNPSERAGAISFVLDGFRTEDVGKELDQEGIAVRSGHHCAQPILRRFGLESTVRASLAVYNICEDIDALVSALLRIQAGRGHRGL